MFLLLLVIMLISLLITTLVIHFKRPRIAYVDRIEERRIDKIHVPWEQFVQDESYIPVENLRDVEKGKRAYIVGSGPSIDSYSEDIWDILKDDTNTIVIGLNQVHIRVPCDYLVQKEKSFRIQTIDYCKKSGAKLVFSQYEYGSYTEDLSRREVEYPTDIDLYMFSHTTNMVDKPIDTRPITEKWQNYLGVSFSTVTSAVSLAALLGCSDCILLGCDMGTVDSGKTNMSGYRQFQRLHENKGKKMSNSDEYAKWINNKCLSQQLRDCIEACEKSYDMSVLWGHPYSSLKDMIENHSDNYTTNLK